MVGRKESSAPMWAKLCQKIDLEDPTKLIDQVFLGCTHREATIDEGTIRTKTERFQRITTSNVEETPNTKTAHKAQRVSSWRYDSKKKKRVTQTNVVKGIASWLKHVYHN